LLIGISGIPASGKSTFAALLVKQTNLLLKSSHIPASSTEYGISGEATPEAIVVPLDGWHLTRAQLDAMPDPKLAYDRRGSHWTFDSEQYVDFVRSLKQASTRVITAPSFDHALKDPAPDTVSIHPFHRIVIIEGLYTFLSIDPWKEAGELLDGRWLIQIDFEEAKRRLVKRHVLTGVAKDEKEAIWRAEENDMPNGHFLLLNTLKPTRIIASIDESSLMGPLLPSGAGAVTVL
jgi:pantothenate kinase